MDSYEKAKSKLKGALAPQLTVFEKDHKLDLESTKKITRFMIDHGHVEGKGVIVPCSGVGFYHLLTTEERKKVAEAVVDAADGRVPVYVGIDSTSTLTSIELAKHAEDSGADGLQVRPPTWPSPADDVIYRHFRMIAEATSLPMLIYNGDKDISLQVLGKLAEIPNIIGLKWYPNDPLLFLQMVELYKNRFALIDDYYYIYSAGGSYIMGSKGITILSSNFYPEYPLRIWHLYEEGKFAEAWNEVKKIELHLALFAPKIRGNWGGLIAAGVDLVGLKGGYARPPYATLSDDLKAELKEVLERANVPKY